MFVATPGSGTWFQPPSRCIFPLLIKNLISVQFTLRSAFGVPSSSLKPISNAHWGFAPTGLPAIHGFVGQQVQYSTDGKDPQGDLAPTPGNEEVWH